MFFYDCIEYLFPKGEFLEELFEWVLHFLLSDFDCQQIKSRAFVLGFKLGVGLYRRASYLWSPL